MVKNIKSMNYLALARILDQCDPLILTTQSRTLRRGSSRQALQWSGYRSPSVNRNLQGLGQNSGAFRDICPRERGDSSSPSQVYRTGKVPFARTLSHFSR